MHWQLPNKQKHSFCEYSFCETSVSDHHKLIGTMLRSAFAKGKPTKVIYRCYKNFDYEKFEVELNYCSNLLKESKNVILIISMLRKQASLEGNKIFFHK